jgi:hypothetical protein
MFCSHGFTSTVRKFVLRYMQVTGYKSSFIGVNCPVLLFLQNNNDAQNICEYIHFSINLLKKFMYNCMVLELLSGKHW